MGQAKKREIKRGLRLLVARKYREITLLELVSSMKHEYAKDKVWVLVEGLLDVYMYSKIFNEDAIQMLKVDKGGIETDSVKKALIAILKDRKAAGVGNVIGIIDKDYEHLFCRNETATNLFETDARDLEITLLTDTDVQNEIKSNIPNIDVLCVIAGPAARYVGYMYIAAESKEKKLGIKKWGASQICKTGTLLNGYEDHILNKLNEKMKKWNEPEFTRTDINDMVSSMQLDRVEDRYIWRGHSTLPIIAQLYGKTGDYTDETISILLADCCSKEHALTWGCFQNIKQWQEANGYDILSKEESLEEVLASI